MLPPPAPTSAMSMAGTRSRKPPPLLSRLPCDMLPPISNSPVRLISPPSMTEALAVVPPMSMLIALPRPMRRASAAVAMTPAAGPDSITCTGRRRPALGGHHAAVRLHDEERRGEAEPRAARARAMRGTGAITGMT